MFNSIGETLDHIFCLHLGNQEQQHGDLSRVLPCILLTGLPDGDVANDHEERVGQVRLHEDGPFRVKTEAFKSVQWNGEVGRIDRVT